MQSPGLTCHSSFRKLQALRVTVRIFLRHIGALDCVRSSLTSAPIAEMTLHSLKRQVCQKCGLSIVDDEILFSDCDFEPGLRVIIKTFMYSLPEKFC